MNALYRVFQKLIKEELRKEMPERWRPAFHVAPPVGWLNDPNGLCQKDGVYHAFFQMAPFEPQGGLKFWGHSVSQDLIHWEFKGVPMLPDQPYDCHFYSDFRHFFSKFKMTISIQSRMMI